MSASTVPATKRALKTLFEGVVEPSTEVWRNRPTEEHQPGENVYVGDARNNTEWSQIGAIPPTRIEDYSIAVIVEVYQEGAGAEACEERMWQVVEQLELALEGAETLPETAHIMEALFNRTTQTSQGGSSGWLCRTVLEVAVKARI
jgi:hypothetical protein